MDIHGSVLGGYGWFNCTPFAFAVVDNRAAMARISWRRRHYVTVTKDDLISCTSWHSHRAHSALRFADSFRRPALVRAAFSPRHCPRLAARPRARVPLSARLTLARARARLPLRCCLRRCAALKTASLHMRSPHERTPATRFHTRFADAMRTMPVFVSRRIFFCGRRPAGKLLISVSS
jgi:hypothetical protein